MCYKFVVQICTLRWDTWYKFVPCGEIRGTNLYLVVRSMVQKPILAKSGQGMPVPGLRCGLVVGSIIFLTSASPVLFLLLISSIIFWNYVWIIIIHIHLVGQHQKENKNKRYKYKICFFLHSNMVGQHQKTKYKIQNLPLLPLQHGWTTSSRPSPYCSLTMDSLRRSPRHHLTPSSMVDTFVLSMSATTTYNHLKPPKTT